MSDNNAIPTERTLPFYSTNIIKFIDKFHESQFCVYYSEQAPEDTVESSHIDQSEPHPHSHVPSRELQSEATQSDLQQVTAPVAPQRPTEDQHTSLENALYEAR